jgi:hypothetical protein
MTTNCHGGVEGYVLANNRIIISTVVVIKEFSIEHIHTYLCTLPVGRGFLLRGEYIGILWERVAYLEIH